MAESGFSTTDPRLARLGPSRVGVVSPAGVVAGDAGLLAETVCTKRVYEKAVPFDISSSDGDGGIAAPPVRTVGSGECGGPKGLQRALGFAVTGVTCSGVPFAGTTTGGALTMASMFAVMR